MRHFAAEWREAAKVTACGEERAQCLVRITGEPQA
jgi:hypothetical protein